MKRTKPPLQKQSGTLAIAKPNKKYLYFGCFVNTVIEARKSGTQIRFYEITDGKQIKCLSRKVVKELFNASSLIKQQPFLKKENREFYKLFKTNTL